MELATLDSFGFTDVGFIKIDVEGHEKEVLDGGLETIRREHPVILIEIEQRHTNTPIGEVFELIRKQGYDGGFLLNGQYHSLNDFSFEKHQKPFIEDANSEHYRRLKGKYVCNFIFEPLKK